MFARRIVSNLKGSRQLQFSSSVQSENEGKNSFVRKAVSFVLITVTGGVALSALDDLAIYHACSSKAIDKASKNQAIIDALGEPIKKGPWYSASLAVAHKRHSVSCSFPVSGPQGSGILQLKAVRNGDDTWLSFLHSYNWEILIMEALLHVPENQEKERTFRINLSGDLPPTDCKACTRSSCPEVEHGQRQNSSAGA